MDRGAWKAQGCKESDTTEVTQPCMQLKQHLKINGAKNERIEKKFETI